MPTATADDAYQDSFSNLMLANDLVDNAQHSKWKLALYLAMVKAIVYALWAIHFELAGWREETK